MTDQGQDAHQVQLPEDPQPSPAVNTAQSPARQTSPAISGRQSDLPCSTVQQEHQPCLDGDSSRNDSENDPQKGQLPRRPLTNLGFRIFSILVGLLPGYFLVFAALAFQAEASPLLPGSRALWLLEAAKYGPSTHPGLTCFDTRILDAGPTHLFNTSVPRRIGLQSFAVDSETPNRTIATDAWCDITTAYVDVMAKCEDVTNRMATAVRKSLSSPWPETATALDGITSMNASALAGDEPGTAFHGGPVAQVHTAANFFFSGFMSSAATRSNGYTDMEEFFPKPDNPFELVASDFETDGVPVYEVTPIADIGAVLFSRRLDQLLNTFWIASYAPLAIMTGSISSDNKVSGSNVTSADDITTKLVLKVNKAWAAGLIIISSLLILAGISGVPLDVWQKSPSVIDFFVSNLRYNSYTEIGEQKSSEDGADMARRLKHTVVQIGDVRPDEDVGHDRNSHPNRVAACARDTKAEEVCLTCRACFSHKTCDSCYRSLA